MQRPALLNAWLMCARQADLRSKHPQIHLLARLNFERVHLNAFRRCRERGETSLLNLMLKLNLPERFFSQTGEKLHLFRQTVQTSDNKLELNDSLILETAAVLRWRTNKSRTVITDIAKPSSLAVITTMIMVTDAGRALGRRQYNTPTK